MINEDAAVEAGQYARDYHDAIQKMALDMDSNAGELPTMCCYEFKAAVGNRMLKITTEMQSHNLRPLYCALTEKDIDGKLLILVGKYLTADTEHKKRILEKQIAYVLSTNARLSYREEIEQEVMRIYENDYAQETIEQTRAERRYLESHI